MPPVAGDPDKVGRVLINLVDNAVKYSPDGGRVTVRVERAGSHVRFAVADEGLGIPPAEQRRVFEKFYRLDPNMTRGVGGTGLGLYICRELVRRMDGRIWVESPASAAARRSSSSCLPLRVTSETGGPRGAARLCYGMIVLVQYVVWRPKKPSHSVSRANCSPLPKSFAVSG